MMTYTQVLIFGILVFIAQSITVIYTCVTDGTPFRGELLTPWMIATLIDFYFNVALIILWVLYREDSWISRLFWVAFLICLGSIGTAAYLIYLLWMNKNTENFPVNIIIKERDLKKYVETK